MCGISKAKLNGLDVELFIGNRGGELVIDNREYSCLRGFAPYGRNGVYAFLLRHRKVDIVDMVLGLVENAEEGQEREIMTEACPLCNMTANGEHEPDCQSKIISTGVGKENGWCSDVRFEDWEREQMKDWWFRFWCWVYEPKYLLVRLWYRWRGRWRM